MSAPQDLSGSLKVSLADDQYSLVGLDWDMLTKMASESPTFRNALQSLLRGLRHHYPKNSDVLGLIGHLTRMDEREESSDSSPAEAPGVPELIEMLKLQVKVNESYARLAILLGEAYVGRAER